MVHLKSRVQGKSHTCLSCPGTFHTSSWVMCCLEVEKPSSVAAVFCYIWFAWKATGRLAFGSLPQATLIGQVTSWILLQFYPTGCIFWPIWAYTWLNFSMCLEFVLFVIVLDCLSSLFTFCWCCVIIVLDIWYLWACINTVDVVVAILTLSGHSWRRDILYCRECSHFCISRSRIRVYIDLFTRS